MTDLADLRMKRMPLNHGGGQMPALGFGTLIPDPAVTITATRDALEAGFRHFDQRLNEVVKTGSPGFIPRG